MDCQGIQREELAEKYVHKRLDVAQMDEYETHVLECPKCARELELLQTMREDLTERAHEIRGWTATKPFFRWQVAALAALAVIAISSRIVLQRKKPSDQIAVQPTPAANQSPIQGARQDTVEKAPDRSKAAGPDTSKTEIASTVEPKKVDSLPINAQDYKNFSHPPGGGSSITGQRARSNTVAVDDKDANEKSVNGQTLPTQVAEENPQVAPTVSHPQGNPGLTTAQGVELARIGMVEAPAYTFSGLVPKGKLPKDEKTGGFSKDHEPQGAGRALFQKGMNQYVDGHYSEAAGYLEQAVQLEPEVADINFYLGICKLLQGRPEESVVPLKNVAGAGQSIYLQPSHYYLAKAYVQGNKLADAEEEFRKAIAVPGRLTSDAKGLLARLQTLRGQIEKP